MSSSSPSRSPLPPPLPLPRPLHNVANHCYVNVTLQTIFSSPHFIEYFHHFRSLFSPTKDLSDDNEQWDVSVDCREKWKFHYELSEMLREYEVGEIFKGNGMKNKNTNIQKQIVSPSPSPSPSAPPSTQLSSSSSSSTPSSTNETISITSTIPSSSSSSSQASSSPSSFDFSSPSSSLPPSLRKSPNNPHGLSRAEVKKLKKKIQNGESGFNESDYQNNSTNLSSSSPSKTFDSSVSNGHHHCQNDTKHHEDITKEEKEKHTDIKPMDEKKKDHIDEKSSPSSSSPSSPSLSSTSPSSSSSSTIVPPRSRNARRRQAKEKALISDLDKQNGISLSKSSSPPHSSPSSASVSPALPIFSPPQYVSSSHPSTPLHITLPHLLSSFTSWGKQEDVSEFYLFLVNNLHEEGDRNQWEGWGEQYNVLLKIQKQMDYTEERKGNQEEEDDQWNEVGKKNKKIVVKSSSSSLSSLSSSSSSPLSSMFHSPLTPLCILRLRTTFHVHSRSTATVTFQPAFTLILDIGNEDKVNDSTPLTLDDCLSSWMNPVSIDGYKGNKGVIGDHTVRAAQSSSIDISYLPHLLFFMIKRFENNYEDGIFKSEQFIEFPMVFKMKYSHLSGFPSWTPPPSLKNINVTSPSFSIDFTLLSVIVHHGDDMSHGHYTSYVRRGAMWYHCNDLLVRRVSWEEVRRQKAYLLFYEKIEI